MEVLLPCDLRGRNSAVSKKKGIEKKMVRSMIAGVSGLRTHQSKLDVIGNNIANVNTWGFKASSFNFLDSMYATSINGSAGSNLAGGAGGRNASQVGYGVTTGSIVSTFGTGAMAPSSENLDCMIDGTGFFLVGNMVNGSFEDVTSSGLSLSRIGIFRVDSNGYLVDDQRNYVYGYMVEDGTGIPEEPAKQSVYTLTGANVTIDATNKTIQIGGVPQNAVKTTSTKFDDMIQDWIAAVTKTNSNPKGELCDFNIALNDFDEANSTVNLTITTKKAGNDANIDSVAQPGIMIEQVRNDFMAAAGGTAEPTVVGNDRVPGIPAVYSDELSAIRIPTDPNTGQRYEIQNYKINEDGTIMGVDNLNRAIPIGQLALITVENPNGLEKTSGYYYSVGPNAGNVTAIKPNGGPAGKIKGNYLEMANVDLANEFSQMITTQRGYQANSKIITVTDQMLEELVNMKR